MEGTKVKSASSAAKSVFIGGLGAKAIAFIGSIVLARILVPEDYGYWVIVTMITSFFSLVVDAGFEYYYVVNVNVNQGEETPDDKIKEIENSIFFLRLIVNTLLFCLQFSFSFLPISLLSSPIDKIIRVLSFIHIINVMGRINEVRLKKRFDFKRITIINITSELLSTIVKVSCAIMGLGVMSFAWGSIGKVLFNNLGLVSTIGRFKPQMRLVLKQRVKDVVIFATYTWLTQVGQYFSTQIDIFLLKSNYTLSQIGLYNFANSTSYMFVQYVLSPQGVVIMNYISNNQRSVEKIERLICVILNFILIIVFPIQLLLYLYAYDFIDIIYGSKWLESFFLFRIFLIYTLIRIMFSPFADILTAFGKVRMRTTVTYVNVVTSFVILYSITFITKDIEVYSIGFICSQLFNLVLKTVLSCNVAKISFNRIFFSLWKSFLLTLFSSLGLILISLIYKPNAILLLITLLIVSMGGHVMLHYYFNREWILLIKQKIFK